MRIGIYPGSFNPIHAGHILLAETAVDTLKLDMLLVMPAAVSPGKQKSAVRDDLRLSMCRAAFASREDIKVSTLETDRGGKSYTADTLDILKQQYQNDELFLLLGADKLPHLDRWYRFTDIASAVKFIIVCRSREDDIRVLEDIAEQKIRPYGECTLMPFSPLEVSSTLIREKLLRGEDITGLVPKAVKAIIEKEGLYRD